jgi:hypothetical protein
VPGKVERREFEYRRHGTQTLIAAFDVATGKIEGVIGNTRTEKDFARFLRRLLCTGALNTRWDRTMAKPFRWTYTGKPLVRSCVPLR